jgi:hypothetical protein
MEFALSRFVLLPSGRPFSNEMVSPYPFSLSLNRCPCGITVGVIPFVCSRAQTRCLRMWEASLHLRAHNLVGTGVEELCNPRKQKLEKSWKTKNPKSPKKRQSKVINVI